MTWSCHVRSMSSVMPKMLSSLATAAPKWLVGKVCLLLLTIYLLIEVVAFWMGACWSQRWFVASPLHFYSFSWQSLTLFQPLSCLSLYGPFEGLAWKISSTSAKISQWLHFVRENAHKTRVMLAKLYSWAIKCSIVRIKWAINLIIHAYFPRPLIAASFPYWLQPRVSQITAKALRLQEGCMLVCCFYMSVYGPFPPVCLWSLFALNCAVFIQQMCPGLCLHSSL